MSAITVKTSKLLEELAHRQRLGTDEAMALLGISQSSVRRLFLTLERAGKAVRVYGGIRLAPANQPAYSFDALEEKNLCEKRQIAACAAALVQDDDILYLDSGTTLLQFALVLKQPLSDGRLRRVKIVTNSLANLQILHDCCDVVLVGGEYRHSRKDFTGFAAERFVLNFHYKKAFLGTDGFDLTEGFTATDTNTARLNEIVIKRSQAGYVLADTTKFGICSFVSFAGPGDVTALITDSGFGPERLAACAAAGLPVKIIN